MPNQTDFGRDWEVYVDTAESEATPTWVRLPEQRTCQVDYNKESQDLASKELGDWNHAESFRRSVSVQVNGWLILDNPALEYLHDTNLHGGTASAPIHLRLLNAQGDTLIGWFEMEAFGLALNENSAGEWNLSAKSRAKDNLGNIVVPTLTRAP